MTLMTLIYLAAGLVLLMGGAEVLVRGASKLAALFGIPSLVIGLTVVAFGTSAPETAVSVQSAFSGSGDLALGNVVGSNIANVLLILGLTALVAPLIVSRQLIRLDVPLLIAAGLLVWALGANGVLSRLDGALLFACIVAYTMFMVISSMRASKKEAQAAALENPESDPAPSRGPMAWLWYLVMIVAGLALLVAGSHFLVEGATALARALGLSDLVIGLTVVAVGTSLPELATSILAAVRGERDIAVGNVVGSGLFNLLCVLGLSALVAPSGIPVAANALAFDFPVMIAVSLACLPIFFTGYLIERWEGLLFLVYYIAYTAYLVLYSTQHDSATLLGDAVLMYALPLTAVTLVVLSVRAWRTQRA
ncbi:sodium:calcium antiporter [Kushneria pakistanensis]|uniref:Sodium:calcium antiporter n=1 Tax=Kushneria pakistanensis TaxID=1508770 RepID=A0ABQ3FI95_9GAMM|nr:calcium/sodium antiporter [Kushneria pakistanensis]GHC25573.1 sodium:calcium antiporter [Kushneria pakistanensis]